VIPRAEEVGDAGTRGRIEDAPLVSGDPRLSGGAESGWSSVLAVSTGRLRQSPALHSRPIDLVVFQEPS
jgi:hypothetical protein